MSGHTPGPWVMEFTGPHTTTRDGYWEIAPIGDDGQPDWSREVAATADANEGNARLIAAAPELLLALRVTLRRFEACLRNNGTDREFAEAATQADWDLIAKAEGQS